MRHKPYMLLSFIEQMKSDRQLSKKLLHFNDLVVVKTRNSIYKMRVLGKNDFLVTGGWFDRKGLAPYRTSINGCTLGGSILKQDIVAGCGMCIEFSNRVTTTLVKEIHLYPSACEN